MVILFLSNLKCLLCLWHKFVEVILIANNKNLSIVFMADMRYIGLILLVPSYVKRATIRRMCSKFNQGKAIKLRDYEASPICT